MEGSGNAADNSGMTDLYDSRDRPVVYETKAESGPRRARPHVRVVAGVAGAAAALAAATGIAWGGSALWSAMDTTTRGNAPAPLWFPPPPQVTAAPSDDHRARRDDPSRTHQQSSTVDNRGGHPTTTPETSTRLQQPEPTDDRSGSGGRGRSPGGPSGSG
jgi:uncharacterized iron-regulated membrane protein